MRTFPPFLKKVLIWASFIGISFLFLSATGLLTQTYFTIQENGWSYEQTIIIGDNSQTLTIYLASNLWFGAWLVFVSIVQGIQLIYLTYLLNKSKD